MYIEETSQILQDLGIKEINQVGDKWLFKKSNASEGRVSHAMPDIPVYNFEDLIERYGVKRLELFLEGYINVMIDYLSYEFSNENKLRIIFEKCVYIFEKLDFIGSRAIIKGTAIDDYLRSPGQLGIVTDIKIIEWRNVVSSIVHEKLKIYNDYFTIDTTMGGIERQLYSESDMSSKLSYVVPNINYEINKSLFLELPKDSSLEELLGFYFINKVVREALKIGMTEEKTFDQNVLNNYLVKTKIFKALDENIIDLYKSTNIDKANFIYKSGKFPIKFDVLPSLSEPISIDKYVLSIFKNWIKL